MKKIASLVFLLVTVTLVSCIPAPDENSIVKWNGMCVPFSHISTGGSFGFMYTRPGPGYIRLRIPSEEVKAEIPNWKPDTNYEEREFTDQLVSVSHKSNISGLSANQDDLVNKILSGEAVYFELENSEFPAIDKSDEFHFKEFDLVKGKISIDDVHSIDPHYWIKAHCVQIEEGDIVVNCYVQRLFKEFTYDFVIDLVNIEYLEDIDRFILEYFEVWENGCKQET
jgi:hypothetical protein